MLLAILIGLPAGAPLNAQYGDCLDRADTYQSRYEASGRASDLVCFQKALERELGGRQQFDCPATAQEYQTAYERHGRAGDLVCFQQALERELW